MGVVPMPADFGAVGNLSFTTSNFRPGAVYTPGESRLRDLLPARRRWQERGANYARLHQQPSRGRSQSGKRQSAGLVGPAVSASTRGPSSPVARLATDPEPLMGERR